MMVVCAMVAPVVRALASAPVGTSAGVRTIARLRVPNPADRLILRGARSAGWRR
jgi:hypothetical protein